ncbi:hypothetical protein TPB0596_25550 [Tsukamurella pulmonis]|uniref:Uncharacterized protein n=1 Tax=Tsukamurella pulmonis TaxID=47312 RepID=A0A1H1EPW9_9ACTN|nr:hypothetical protein [Tsukamurella pulmonis]RDH11887.1 hypothetical protein DVB88_10350 [Tsukamurella pulmonis]BDD82792.1 hypothetical protein TPB0596_25550 [Tsukamurella pulmonis]SDQ90795.1 hypothetical protein SAMN04489765_2305 [Tsukamurella pulmonis]SUP20628.1 Uncharacterised protein [Tsukamurella pulmonis]
MSGRQGLSLGRLALFSVGAAVAVLGLCVLLLNVLRPSPAVGLLIVAVGLIGAVAAMGAVSKTMVRRAVDGAEDREPGNPDDSTH